MFSTKKCGSSYDHCVKLRREHDLSHYVTLWCRFISYFIRYLTVRTSIHFVDSSQDTGTSTQNLHVILLIEYACKDFAFPQIFPAFNTAYEGELRKIPLFSTRSYFMDMSRIDSLPYEPLFDWDRSAELEAEHITLFYIDPRDLHKKSCSVTLGVKVTIKHRRKQLDTASTYETCGTIKILAELQ